MDLWGKDVNSKILTGLMSVSSFEYFEVNLSTLSSFKWAAKAGSGGLPEHCVQRRIQRVRGGARHHPRHRPRRPRLHRQKVQGQDEEDWGDQVKYE